MKLNELMEKYGDYEVKEGFMDFLEKPKPKTVLDLKDGDRYCYITADGELRFVSWQNDESDKNKLYIGNIFLTEEDAEFAVERLKVAAELKEYAKEFSDEEWMNKDLLKYFIGFEYKLGDFSCYIANLSCYIANLRRGSEIYFESIQKANEAIEAVGKDRVKKYYLGVKE